MFNASLHEWLTYIYKTASAVEITNLPLGVQTDNPGALSPGLADEHVQHPATDTLSPVILEYGHAPDAGLVRRGEEEASGGDKHFAFFDDEMARHIVLLVKLFLRRHALLVRKNLAAHGKCAL